MGDEDFQFRTVLSIQLQLSGQELTQVSNTSNVNTQKMPFWVKPVLHKALYPACDHGSGRCYLVRHSVSLAIRTFVVHLSPLLHQGC